MQIYKWMNGYILCFLDAQVVSFFVFTSEGYLIDVYAEKKKGEGRRKDRGEKTADATRLIFHSRRRLNLLPVDN